VTPGAVTLTAEDRATIEQAAITNLGATSEQAAAIAADDQLALQVPVSEEDASELVPAPGQPAGPIATIQASTSGCYYNLHNFRTYQNILKMSLARFNAYSDWCWSDADHVKTGSKLRVNGWIAAWAVGWDYVGTVNGTPYRWRLAGGGVGHARRRQVHRHRQGPGPDQAASPAQLPVRHGALLYGALLYGPLG